MGTLRMAASFEILGRHRGFSAGNRRAIVTAGVRSYRNRMRQAAGMGTLDAWYDQLEVGAMLDLVRQQARVKRLGKKETRWVHRHVDEAYTRDHAGGRAGGPPRRRADRGEPSADRTDEDLAVPGVRLEDPVPLIKKLLASYRRTLGAQGHPLEEFRYLHAARKVVGVGSVGTRCYILLLTGRDHNDPLFLQAKES
jgi:hypothetical protein